MQVESRSAGGRKEAELLALTLAYWLLWIFCFDVRVPRPDAIGYFVYAQSLLIDGDLSVSHELTRWGIDPIFVQQTSHGHLNNVFACGAALLWLPFLALAHGLLCAAKLFGSTHPTDGYSPLYLGAAAFASAVYGYLALVLSYRCACRFVSKPIAASATFSICLFSPLWHYLCLEGTMSHAASAFGASLFLWLLLHLWSEPAGRSGGRSMCWAVLGYVGGMLSIVRWQDCLLPCYVGACLLLEAIRASRPTLSAPTKTSRSARWAPFICYVTSYTLALIPQALIWQVQNGSPLAIPQGNQFFSPMHPAVGAVLFSSSHSLFAWTPLVAFSVLGFVPLARCGERSLVRLFVAVFVLQTYVNSIVADPSAGASFGARRFLGLTPFFIIGLALIFASLPKWVSALIVLVCGSWTVLIWLAFIYGFIDPLRYVSFQDISLALLRTSDFISTDPSRIQPRAWELLSRQVDEWLMMWLAAAVIVVCATRVAYRSARVSLRGFRRTGAVLLGVLVVGVVSGLGAAAARSSPMPIDGVRVGRHTVLNFGSYANARSDGDPFNPPAHVLGEFRVPSQLQWGRTPFWLLPPTRDTNAAPSSLTTCGVPDRRFQIELAQAPTRAVHFAVCGLNAWPVGTPVLTVAVELDSGERVEHTLRAGVDIWDFFAATPSTHTIYASIGSVTGFTLPLPSMSVPVRLAISSPLQSTAQPACAAVFGITQAMVDRSTNGDREQYRSVDLRSAANADYAYNAFRAAPILNFYPDLRPGLLEVDGVPYLIPSRAYTPYDANVLSIRPFGKRGIRLPLQQLPSNQLSMLIAIRDGGSEPREISRVEIEFADGSRSMHSVWSYRDVVSYVGSEAVPESAWRGAGAQRLSKFAIPLHGRTPKYAWIVDTSDTSNEMINRSLSIFAITQTTAL